MSSGRRLPSNTDIQPMLRPGDVVSVSLACRIQVDGPEYQKAEASIVSRNIRGYDAAAVFIVVPPCKQQDTPPSPSVSFFHQSSRPHITLSLQDRSNKVDLRISATHTIIVQALITELRRLIESSRISSVPKSQSHSWIQHYPVEPPIVWSDDELPTPGESSTSSMMSPASSSMSVQTIQTPLSGLTLAQTLEDEHPNPFLPRFSRTAFLRKRLFKRQDRWSNRRPVRIRLATFNVNDKLPPKGSTELRPLVGDGEDELLVFGLQEVDLRSQALLLSQGSGRAQEWEEAILGGLMDKAEEYEKLVTAQYVGVVMIVFVKKSIREFVTRVETSERGIGLLGFGGNKAGVCVRLKVYDTTLCFVNSHLAAFATALDRRRSDYQTLLKTLTFLPVEGVQPVFEEFASEVKDRLVSVEDAHILFWMGDLNYRVEMEDDILRAWVEEKRWTSILEKDQLIADITSRKSFGGFQEAHIDFPPSFKYVHGSTTLDTKRSPAYTDRILYTHPPQSTLHSAPTPIVSNSYTSHSILWSDHRPVGAAMTVQARVVDEVKRRECLVEVERELERLEEVYRPSLEVVGSSVDFGEVRYGRQNVREVVLKNKGRVDATFGFKTQGVDRPICKSCIWVVPSQGTLEPDQETRLKVSMFMDEEWSRRVTLGEDDVNDVLVLQVHSGKDTFLTIQAVPLPSIISLPLPLLTILPTPIRQTTMQARKALISTEGSDPYQAGKGSKPVKEVWRLLEYLMSAGPGVTGLWVDEVDHEDVLHIIDCVDAGRDLPEHAAKSVGAALLHVLSALPDPLLPTSVQAMCEKCEERDEVFAILEGVSQINTNVLIGLMSVIRLCLSSSTSTTSDQAKPEGEKQAKAVDNVVDDKLLDVLVPAVFGVRNGVLGVGEVERRRRVVRLLLEG